MNRPSLKDMLIFSRQMHSMQKARIPLNQAISLISDSTLNPALKQTLHDIVDELESGYSLARSFQKHPEIFPSIVVAMTQVGEETGQMATSFLYISQYYDFEIKTRKRLKQVSRYPMIVLIVICIAFAIINVLIVPKFKEFFSQFGAALPWSTQILINTSDLLLHHWLLLMLALVFIISGFRFWLDQPNGRLTWDWIKLKLPFLGSIIERSYLARFCRALALAIEAGVPLNQALTVVSLACENYFLSEKIHALRRGIERGETFSHSMAGSKLFSNLVLQMIIIGEETADLDGMLLQVADFYEEELEYDVKQLSDTLEPVLVGIVAVFVLILALGVFLPMWDITSIAFNKMHSG